MDTYSIPSTLIIFQDVNNFFWLFDPPPKSEGPKIYFPLLVEQHIAVHMIINNNDVCELHDFDIYVDFVDGFVDQVDDIVDLVDDIVDQTDDIVDLVDDIVDQVDDE